MKNTSKTLRTGGLVRSIFWLGVLFLYLPVVFVIIYSFNEHVYPTWTQFSWRWYQDLWKNKAFISGIFVSLRVAFLSAWGSVFVGTSCALVLVRGKSWLNMQPSHRLENAKSPWLEMLAKLPLVVPEAIMGLALVLFFVGIKRVLGISIQGGTSMLVVAHTMLGFSYTLSIVHSRLLSVEPQLEEAAQDLGASPNKVFFVITLPLIWPSLAAGFLLSFVLSFDDVVLASFTAGAGNDPLSLVLFSSLKRGLTPEINALGTLLILSVGVVAIGAACIVGKWPYWWKRKSA